MSGFKEVMICLRIFRNFERDVRKSGETNTSLRPELRIQSTSTPDTTSIGIGVEDFDVGFGMKLEVCVGGADAVDAWERTLDASPSMLTVKRLMWKLNLPAPTIKRSRISDFGAVVIAIVRTTI